MSSGEVGAKIKQILSMWFVPVYSSIYLLFISRFRKSRRKKVTYFGSQHPTSEKDCPAFESKLYIG